MSIISMGCMREQLRGTSRTRCQLTNQHHAINIPRDHYSFMFSFFITHGIIPLLNCYPVHVLHFSIVGKHYNIVRNANFF